MRARLLVALLILAGCKGDAPDAQPATPAVDPGPRWAPGVRYPTPRAAGPRGLLDRRGLIHAHSPYSHDACDGEPRDAEDALDQGCMSEFRKGLCDQQMDFVMVTDHDESFGRSEFPDVLLYRASEGDALIERGGGPTANRLNCVGRDPVVLLAGTESGTMPVGLERHVPGTPEVRHGVYDEVSAASLDAFHQAGAVNLAQHTEDWSPEELATLPFDGFEMYNLHANAYLGAGALVKSIALLKKGDEGLPHPDLVIVPVITEDPAYLSSWGSVFARGARRVTTMGTDCHRNSFPQILPDGERIDSYRRMMGWFSNHLLVRPSADGTWDDLSLKEALRAGRLYGAFEVLGTPVGFDGFDYRATTASAVHEMGEQVSLAAGVSLRVTMPRVSHLDPALTPPSLTARVLRAREGGWDPVATGTGDLAYTPTETGAYRAEIRMVPRHLAGALGAFGSGATEGDPNLAETADLVWIYANVIYVVP